MEDCIAYLAAQVKRLQEEKEKTSSRQELKNRRPPKRPVTGAQRVKSRLQDQDEILPREIKQTTEESMRAN